MKMVCSYRNTQVAVEKLPVAAKLCWEITALFYRSSCFFAEEYKGRSLPPQVRIIFIIPSRSPCLAAWGGCSVNIDLINIHNTIAGAVLVLGSPLSQSQKSTWQPEGCFGLSVWRSVSRGSLVVSHAETLVANNEIRYISYRTVR